MGNILGDAMPTIYVDTLVRNLPVCVRSGRNENFEAETVTWTDINRKIHQRIKGYRLVARYEWAKLSNDDFETVLDIYNRAIKANNIMIKFSIADKRFPVLVSDFEHDLAFGYSNFDSCAIEFRGTTLSPSFFNPDDYYTISRTINRRIVI